MTLLRSREDDVLARRVAMLAPAVSLSAAAALIVTLVTGNGWALALVLAVGIVCTQTPSAAAAFAVAVLLTPNIWLSMGLFYEKLMVGAVLIGALVTLWLRDPTSLTRPLRLLVPHAKILTAMLLAPIAFMTMQVVLAPADWRHAIAERAADYALALLLGCLVVAERSADSRRRTAWWLVALGVGEAVLAGLQAAFRGDLVWGGTLNAVQREEATNIHGYFRGIGTVGHGNSLALVLVLVTCIAAWLLVTATTRRERSIAILALVLIVLGVLSSLSRAGMLAIGLMCIGVAFWGVRKITWSRRRVVGAIGLGLLVALALVVVPPLRHSAERFLPGHAAARDAGSGDVRAALGDASLRAFEARPVAGWGYGTDVFVLSRYNPGLWRLGTHDTYLDLLVGGGVVGAALFLAAGLACAWFLRRVKGRERLLIGLTLLVILSYAFFETLMAAPALVLIGAVAGLAAWAAAPEHELPGPAE